jgi:hypothetical protein
MLTANVVVGATDIMTSTNPGPGYLQTIDLSGFTDLVSFDVHFMVSKNLSHLYSWQLGRPVSSMPA